MARTGLVLALGLTLAAAALAPTLTAEAAPPAATSDKDKARGLAKDGIKAFEGGDATHALDLLQQAEALFHAPTHVLYIARCEAKLGKLLDARSTYQKLVGEDLGKKPPEAFANAQSAGKTELADLEAKMPHIRIAASPASPPGLTITMNGAPAQSGTIDVDPGSYTFEASADGGLRAKTITVTASPSSTAEVRLALEAPAAPKPVETSGKPSGTKIFSIAAMAVGGAGLVAGGVLGGLSFKKRGDADSAFDACEASLGKGHCSGSQEQDVKDLDDTATTFGNASIGALSAGAAFLVTGVVVFAVSGKKGDEKARTGETPVVEPVAGPGYFGLRGTF